MSDGYISTKNLSGEEALTGVARGEALARRNEIEELINKEALVLANAELEKRKKEKKSTKRKERKKKEL
jgi:uncharacterized protein YpuA (DUF1002 family)